MLLFKRLDNSVSNIDNTFSMNFDEFMEMAKDPETGETYIYEFEAGGNLNEASTIKQIREIRDWVNEFTFDDTVFIRISKRHIRREYTIGKFKSDKSIPIHKFWIVFKSEHDYVMFELCKASELKERIK